MHVDLPVCFQFIPSCCCAPCPWCDTTKSRVDWKVHGWRRRANTRKRLRTLLTLFRYCAHTFISFQWISRSRLQAFPHLNALKIVIHCVELEHTHYCCPCAIRMNGNKRKLEEYKSQCEVNWVHFLPLARFLTLRFPSQRRLCNSSSLNPRLHHRIRTQCVAYYAHELHYTTRSEHILRLCASRENNKNHIFN